MALPARRKKKKAAARKVSTGIKGAPMNKGYRFLINYFHFDVDSKECVATVKNYVRKNFNKKDAAYILRVPDWRLQYSHIAGYCYWIMEGKEAPEDTVEWMDSWFEKQKQWGKELSEETKVVEQKKKNAYVPTIQERMQEQLSDLIGELEQWLDLQPNTDIPKFFDWLKTNNVAQAHINKIKDYYLPIQVEYKMLLEKNCPADLKEGYAHLTKPKIKQVIKWFEALNGDLDAYANLKKTTRKSRVKKAPSKDKLVSKVKYCKQDNKYKIVSVDPADIVGATELWVFNTKTRKLGKYVAQEHTEFSVKGTTILYFDENKSVQKTLRKPEEQIKEFNKSGKVALRKFMDNITAVETKMNGRLNEHTVLLKVS